MIAESHARRHPMNPRFGAKHALPTFEMKEAAN
jgi:hypothetical protein